MNLGIERAPLKGRMLYQLSCIVIHALERVASDKNNNARDLFMPGKPRKPSGEPSKKRGPVMQLLPTGTPQLKLFGEKASK